jgi:hypothetical protein
MKILSIAMACVAMLSTDIAAQVEEFGLQNLVVTDLRFYGNTLYACTDGAGVFQRVLGDTGWTSLGLTGKNLRSVYPHQVGSLGFAITVGVDPDRSSGDSALVYCWSAGQWMVTDTGMDRSSVSEIRSVDGIPTPQVCGETFAAGPGKTFIRRDVVWETMLEGLVYDVVRVSPTYTVWVGGETLIFSPYLAKSTDLGATWTEMFPDLGGDNACNAIAFHPTDTNIVYAGMEGVVIKSTDAGATWQRTAFTNTPFYIKGLALDPANPDHLYAGGIATPDSIGLAESFDGGDSWRPVLFAAGTDGLSAIAVNPSDGEEVFLSTLGSGVWRYRSLPVAVNAFEARPDRFRMYDCFPNPFNPATTIRYELPTASFVTLDVLNILGQVVATLVSDRQGLGTYDVRFDGSGLPSGVYICRIRAGSHTDTRELLLVR